MTVTTLTPTNDTFELPVKLVVADPKHNTRKNLADIDKLAKSIDYEGQQTPVLVAKREDGKYDLIYGFRRFAAMSWSKEDGGLGRESIKARIVDAMTPEERLLTNLIENMAREDLSSYDTAMACAQLEQLTKGELSGAKIANKVGKAPTYVNNLLRAIRNLPPNIVQRWKDENSEKWDEIGKGTKKVCTTDNLARLAKDSFTAEERQLAFRKLTGEATEEEVQKAKSTGSAAGEDVVKRASKSALESALKAALSLKKKKPNDLALIGAIAALNFALGDTDGIKGIYDPADEEKETAEPAKKAGKK